MSLSDLGTAILAMGPKIAEHITSWAMILGAISGTLLAIGWDLPPFASMGRVETVEERQAKQEVTDRSTLCVLLDVQRQTWELAHGRAEADLKKNPESESAKDALRRAEKKLRQIDRNIRNLGPSCPI